MAQFQVSTDPELNLLVLVAEGDISVDDVVDAVAEHFASHPMRNVLWDFSCARIDGLRNMGLMRIARASSATAAARGQGARTAFVARGVLADELVELFRTFTIPFASPIEYRLFADRASALGWLGRR
jgi:hypothetical protein